METNCTELELQDKVRTLEVENLEQGIEIEGWKQKNILLTDKLETKKVDCITWEHKYNHAREVGNKAIHSLEMSQFWKGVLWVALSVAIGYSLVITFIHFHS
jgi:hypothetical protein